MRSGCELRLRRRPMTAFHEKERAVLVDDEDQGNEEMADPC